MCPERIEARKKTPVGQKSVNCCRWQTSTAWTTSRTCSRKTIAEFMENGLEAELDKDLGYSKYGVSGSGVCQTGIFPRNDFCRLCAAYRMINESAAQNDSVW